jgi:hypothetical protein
LAQRLAWRAGDLTAFESVSVTELKGRAKVGYLAEKARRTVMRAWARVPLEGDRGAMVTELSAAGACGRAHVDAYWAYDPLPYSGRVALVRSSNQPHGVEPDRTLGWGPLLQGEAELYEIPSFHGNIIHGERVPMVADVLRASVEKALEFESRSAVGGTEK